MKQLKFSVPIFDVDVILIQVENKDDCEEVINILTDKEVNQGLKDEIADNIINDRVDGGVTCYSSGMHLSIIVFYEMESEERKEVCYAHEKRHLEDRIIDQCRIDDKETPAYLAGFLSTYFRKLYNMK